MPTVEEVGTRWVHPKGQVRYYVGNFREITGIDAPKKVKVWMDRFGEVHVVYCDDKDMEIQIIRAMDKYMRGDRKVVCSYTSNCERMFIILASGKNMMSYDNIESVKKRILALRMQGYHIIRLVRTVVRACETYTVCMDTSTYYDGRYTAGYQKVDIDDSVIYLTYHGKDDIRRDVSSTYNYNCSRIQQGYQEVFIPYPWVPHHIGMKFHGEIYD